MLACCIKTAQHRWQKRIHLSHLEIQQRLLRAWRWPWRPKSAIHLHWPRGFLAIDTSALVVGCSWHVLRERCSCGGRLHLQSACQPASTRHTDSAFSNLRAEEQNARKDMSKSAGQQRERGAPPQKEHAADEINELRKYIGKTGAELGDE